MQSRKMDFDKYFKVDKDGEYNLHFFNKDRLSALQIKEIFSAYGKVIQVNFCGKNGGLTFIKYKTLREAICCLKSCLQDNNIEMLPEKSKMGNCNERMDNGGSSQHQVARAEDSVQRTFRQSSSDAMRSNRSDSSEYNRKSSFPWQQTSTEVHSSEATIDCEKYYRQSRDGTYTVHFVNKNNLTDTEITEMFSAFGNVLSIHSGGDTQKLKFVRYQMLEEIVECIKGIHSNGVINLLQQKDKRTNTKVDNQRDMNQPQAARAENSSQSASGTFGTDQRLNSSSVQNGERPSYNPRLLMNKMKDFDHHSDTASRSSRQGSKFSDGDESKRKNARHSPMSDENHSHSRQNSMDNGYNRAMRDKETKFSRAIKSETDAKPDRGMRVRAHNYKVPALVSDTETMLSDCDAMSDRFWSNGTRDASSKVVHIPLQEVIVANIHTSYGLHYILHLFEQHGPISGTLVRTIAEKDIRYCHVYFKTVQDAAAVEEEFDNFDLAGKNLIVLRKSHLINATI
ncbi:PREDICTED: uncharacterized protein LOC105568688 [Vollenhovia emeryi]|uniref:uncharacterized protein LOC105568688 n=1 Tax=Vollenhovia emeryi TaxID=411798 RepID=UPI0005F3C079|nr:PREDICTED: uncharacterized protein LOC105568688 [Vollenhovia emeryi]